MADLYETVLPSGRGIRYRRLTTKDYLACQERVAALMGDRPDPGNMRRGNAVMKDTLCVCTAAVTKHPLEWVEKDGAPDVDAMLSAKGVKWEPVTHEEMTGTGWKSFDELFGDLDDFQAAVELIQGAARPTQARAKALAGLVRKISTT